MKYPRTDQLNDKWLRIIIVPLSTVVQVLVQMPFYFPGRYDLALRLVGISIVFTIILWETTRLLLVAIRERYPSLAETGKRLRIYLTLFIPFLGLMQMLLLWLIDRLQWFSMPVFVWQAYLTNMGAGLFYVIVLSAAYEAIYVFGKYKQALVRTEQLKKKQAQSRLDALKSRVNPHFLFNSLTTLSALIGENGAHAERFVDELAKVYRYLLRANRLQTATIQDELQFLRAYLFLMETRFGAAFIMNVDIPEAFFDKNLPVSALQTVTDYLLRTQIIEPRQPLQIDVRCGEDGLHMACPHQPKTVFFDASGIEWSQIEESFSRISGQPVRLEIQGNRLSIHVPFVQIPVAA